MKLATSAMIAEIDAFASETLGISVKDLMAKSGSAVARAVKEFAPENKPVVILAGKGNNGGDGYAAAVQLLQDYDVIVYDVFSEGQKNAEGKHFADLFVSAGGRVESFTPTDEVLAHIKNAGCIVDAIFGTGFHGSMPELLRPLAIAIRESVCAQKIAVDVPLGVNADNGSVSEFAISATATVELAFIKSGILSYPARAHVGKIIYDALDLPYDTLTSAFSFRYELTDADWARATLPKREKNSNKGTYGKLLMITGSDKYRGAAHLALEAALRGGVGLATYAGTHRLIAELSQKFPEAIYNEIPPTASISKEDLEKVLHLAEGHTAVLLGSGSDNTAGLSDLTLAMLEADGSPLVLDADAINALSALGERGAEAIKNSKRTVILTPHPLEFARLVGHEVSYVQAHRLELAEKFAKENNCILVLKGAGTLITDGEHVYINVTGGSALSKAGSGDVLAGLIAAFTAQNKLPPLKAAALAVYYHATAGDSLATELSNYGVTPSDLPREIARKIAETEKQL